MAAVKLPKCLEGPHNIYDRFSCRSVLIYFRFSSVQFNSHLFLSPIGARTLKMPVPYSPPSVGAYTRTPSHQPPLGLKGVEAFFFLKKTRNLANCDQTWPKLSAIDVTSQAFFEHFCLVPGLRQFLPACCILQLHQYHAKGFPILLNRHGL